MSAEKLLKEQEKLTSEINAIQKLKTGFESEIESLKGLLTEQEESLMLMETKLEDSRPNMAKCLKEKLEVTQELSLCEHKIKNVEANLRAAEKNAEAHLSNLTELEQQKTKIENEMRNVCISQANSLNPNDEQVQDYFEITI